MSSFAENNRDNESPWLDRWADWILKHRALVLATIALVTLPAAWLVAGVHYRGAIVEAFVDDPAQYDNYCRLCEEFGANSDDLVFVGTDEGDRLFTPEILSAVRAAAQALGRLPEVESVTSLPDVPHIPRGRLTGRQVITRSAARRKLHSGSLKITARELDVAAYWPESSRRQAGIDLAALREDALADPLVRGIFVSPDGRAQAMVVRLKSAAAVPLARQEQLRPQIESILREHGLGHSGIHVAGMIPVQGWIFEEMDRMLVQIMPIGGLVLALILWCMFERIAVILVTGLTALVAIVWSIAFAAIVFGELSILVAAAPLLILVITTAESVYLTSAYRKDTQAGLPRDVALRKMVREVGGACLLASLTTFVGFASLVTVGAPTMRHMGLTVAVGVAIGLLLALTIVPILYSFLKPFPRLVGDAEPNRVQRWIIDLVAVCRRLASRRPRTILAVAVALSVVAVVIALPMRIDPDVPARFPAAHPLPRSVDFFSTRMSGTTCVELFLSADPGRWTDPDAVRRLVELHRAIEQVDGVRAVRSIVDLYQTTQRVIGFGTPDGLPPTQIAAETGLEFAGVLDPDVLQTFVNSERDRLRIVIQLGLSGYIEVMTLSNRIAQLAAASMPGDVKVEVLGSHPIVGGVVRRIVQNYFYGNILSALTICATLAWGLGSLRVAFWGMFPNLLPMCLLGAVLVLTLDTLDSDLMIIPMCALGIAVDDTIHFLHRYRHRLQQTGDPQDALEYTLDYTGAAMLETTLLLSAGLAPYALSPFLSVWMLGTYMVLALLFAVAGELLITPAMARLGLFRWRETPAPLPQLEAGAVG